MLGQLFKGIGFIVSYIYTYKVADIIQRTWSAMYTGWMKRRFKRFEGHITGAITLQNSDMNLSPVTCVVGKRNIVSFKTVHE